MHKENDLSEQRNKIGLGFLYLALGPRCKLLHVGRGLCGLNNPLLATHRGREKGGA